MVINQIEFNFRNNQLDFNELGYPSNSMTVISVFDWREIYSEIYSKSVETSYKERIILDMIK